MSQVAAVRVTLNAIAWFPCRSRLPRQSIWLLYLLAACLPPDHGLDSSCLPASRLLPAVNCVLLPQVFAVRLVEGNKPMQSLESCNFGLILYVNLLQYILAKRSLESWGVSIHFPSQVAHDDLWDYSHSPCSRVMTDLRLRLPSGPLKQGFSDCSPLGVGPQ